MKIGVLNDQSGLYADLGGPGSVVAAKMAAEEFGNKVAGSRSRSSSPTTRTSLISAPASRPSGTTWTRWTSSSTSPTPAVALAIAKVTADKNKVFIDSGAATSDLTGKACTPNTVHWTYDTWSLANGTGKEVVKAGGDTWFFLVADYAFGKALERDTTAVVVANGGKVLGSVSHPLNASDFSSFLLQAQASKAKIIGLANAGGDTINSIKAASEFGIVQGGQKLAGLLVFISDVHALGLKTANGLQLTSCFYWDRDDKTRAWSKKFAARMNGRMPTMVQAGVYAGVLHYLKAVQALKAKDDGKAVVAKMKALPTDDPLFGKGTIRADGRKIHPMYLYEVKKPSESKGPWDYYKLVKEIPADQAFRPLAQGDCPLVSAAK